MSAHVVQFPTGGAHPSAPLSKDDERVLALIRRSLAAWHALSRDCSRLTADGSAEAKEQLDRLGKAVTVVEDQLAAIAEKDIGHLEQ
jgi:hypothetical protein